MSEIFFVIDDVELDYVKLKEKRNDNPKGNNRNYFLSFFCLFY